MGELRNGVREEACEVVVGSEVTEVGVIFLLLSKT